MKYIAYYRVSTKKQGKSGLGLAAQKKAVINYLKGAKPFDAFTDIESGKNNNRPELKKALELCKKDKEKYTLVIAKIDRLSRNLTFISSLMDSKIKFVACDMPNANNFTIHIFSALAQQERELISERTTNSLESIKDNINKKGFHIAKNGNKIKSLGKPKNLTDKSRKKGTLQLIEKSLKNENNKKAYQIITLLKEKNLKWSEIVKNLNENDFKTANGYNFQIVQAQRIYNKYNKYNKL